MIDKLTERGLQFVALVLGGRAARGMLMDFYMKRGLEDSDAQEKIAGQTRFVRICVIPLGLVFLGIGMYFRSSIEDPGYQLSASISIYFGLFMLACQLPRGKSASTSWDSLKTLLKK